MRRSIIQTLAVVDDVIKAAGKAPQKIIPIKLTKPYEVKNSVISLPEASPAPTIVPIKTKAI